MCFMVALLCFIIVLYIVLNKCALLCQRIECSGLWSTSADTGPSSLGGLTLGKGTKVLLHTGDLWTITSAGCRTSSSGVPASVCVWGGGRIVLPLYLLLKCKDLEETELCPNGAIIQPNYFTNTLH